LDYRRYQEEMKKFKRGCSDKGVWREKNMLMFMRKSFLGISRGERVMGSKIWSKKERKALMRKVYGAKKVVS
jgi:hypothetical protein